MARTARPIKYGRYGSIQERLDDAPPAPAIAAITGGIQHEEAAIAANTPVNTAPFDFVVLMRLLCLTSQDYG